jgi:hypothetical protein
MSLTVTLSNSASPGGRADLKPFRAKRTSKAVTTSTSYYAGRNDVALMGPCKPLQLAPLSFCQSRSRLRRDEVFLGLSAYGGTSTNVPIKRSKGPMAPSNDEGRQLTRPYSRSCLPSICATNRLLAALSFLLPPFVPPAKACLARRARGTKPTMRAYSQNGVERSQLICG